MNDIHTADQEHAALLDCWRFRTACGPKYVHRLAGPLAQAEMFWTEAEGTQCGHFDPDAPQPLWALLERPGDVMCMPCWQAMAALLQEVGTP